ncbi:uncharacterized protein LOC129969078 [Argiope bruennichi]|uniref:uncharacterized protein LOC129969078 n=1 Tax=Argiope bruennichi TaxID=94029 RepID=UPI002494214B|nr:uncharacterized protein LOC129969078 [Argiope bruennichi]
MADNGACCSGSNLVVDVNNEEDNEDPGEFEISHWNEDAEDEETNDSNIGAFSQDADTISYMDTSLFLEFPKFSKGFKASDFNEFVQKYVGEENVVRLENWGHPNVWLMQVENEEIRENLLRMWKTKIKSKTCWIKPYYEYELRGFLHWLPHFVSDDDVKTQLAQFGDVILLENETHEYWNGQIMSDVRYFGLRLKDGMVKNDLPHFLKFDGYRTLVIVRGRQPACFHCREFGHSKRDCKRYKERLDKYCKNPETSRPRTKPRGRRHKPVSDNENDDGNKHQDKAKSNSASTNLAQKDAKHVKSCLKRTCSLKKPADDKKSKEILAILRSLKEWEECTVEMMEQVLSNIETNLMHSILPKITETEDESSVLLIETMIKTSVNQMKQITISMIKQTLNNLRNIVVKHFGLDSNEPLEKLISNFEATKEEKSRQKEVRFVE